MSVFVPRPDPAPLPYIKAGPVGPGAGVLTTEYLMPMMLPTDAQRKVRMSLTVGRDVSWIRAAERVISGKIGGDPDLTGAVRWNLEDPDGKTIDDEYHDSRAVEAYTLIRKPANSLGSSAKQVTCAKYQWQLWEVTSRHMGLAGAGYWFLDSMGGDGIPGGLLYIRPDRLIPFTDGAGNLTAWSLDPKDATRPETGMRLELNEVLQFPLETPTDGWCPPGLIESAILKAQINGHIDKFLGSLLGSSGKLQGMFAPKVGAIDNDQVWDQLVRDTRNIAEQPDAAKRMQLFRAPMEYTRTGATVAEMAIIELMARNRDDLLALWGVPLSQVGGNSPTGLNSGDIRKYDEAALWQNAVVMRLVPMKQIIQTELLDRWIAYMGWAPKLVLDIPEFDDDSPRYDKIQKSMNIAMTNDERRALVNADPIPPEVIGPTGIPLGQEVWMPNTVSPLGIAPTPQPTVQVQGELTPAWSAYAKLAPPPATVGATSPPGAAPTSGIPTQSPDKPQMRTMVGVGGAVPAGGAGATLKAKKVDGPDVVPAVLAALRKQWPASELDIVKQGQWTFDPAFPIKKINATRRPVARNPKIVAGAEAVLAIGAPIAPITIIHTKRIGKPGYEPIDGWHRVLAAEHQGLKKIPAYVGEGDDQWTQALIAFDDDIPTPPDSAADQEPASDTEGKARTFRSGMLALRSRFERQVTPQVRSSVALVLGEQKRDIADRVRTMYDRIKAAPKDTSLWWPTGNRWDQAMSTALRPLGVMTEAVNAHVKDTYGGGKAGPLAPQGALAYVLQRGASRVTRINDTTRQGIADLIASGIEDGLSPAELGDAVEAWSGFDEYRSELIARTELMDAYNAAALGSYDEAGVSMVQAIDGDADEECAARDGQTFSLEEADGIEDHPNGTLDWVPVIE